jgi:hypothetical protein
MLCTGISRPAGTVVTIDEAAGGIDFGLRNLFAAI